MAGIPWFWHGIGKSVLAQRNNPSKMKPNAERARKLKDAATRMMMAGDVERYMRALRLLITLRGRSVALA